MMPQKPGRFPIFRNLGLRQQKLLLALLLGATVSILLAATLWAAFRGISNTSTGNTTNIATGTAIPSGQLTAIPPTKPTAVPTAPKEVISPLLFGTNIGLFNSNDQVLNSASTRSTLQKLHVTIIRMPIRSSLSEATEIQAAQIIKGLGAIPLVILRGAVDTTVLADDTRIINDMNRIFDNSLVYYEYGNEEDLLGVDVSRYIISWNSIVPQLKKIALHGHFVGPVNYQYDRAYLTSFLQNAQPRPDEVSWHEYTCDDSWASDICISHIDHWTNHISDGRAAMVSAIGMALPIMITEWNYAPNAVPNDGKNNNTTFMSTWTAKALQTLAANRIFASMQYSCTDTAISMVDGNGITTTQGTTFQATYQQMILNGQQPAPVSPTSTPAPPQSTPPPTSPTPSAGGSQQIAFSFEDGSTNGWSGHGSGVSNVQNSTTLAYDGKHALQVTLVNVTSGDFPYVSVDRSNLTTYPQAGQTITAYVYLSSNSVSLVAKVLIMDNNYQWHDDVMDRLTPGVWNRLTYTVPTSLSGQPRQLGIQFSTLSSMPVGTDVYVDAVGWG